MGKAAERTGQSFTVDGRQDRPSGESSGSGPTSSIAAPANGYADASRPSDFYSRWIVAVGSEPQINSRSFAQEAPPIDTALS